MTKIEPKAEIIQSTKLMVYAPNFAKTQSACQYYRISVPVLGLQKLGYVDGFIDMGTIPQNDSIHLMVSSDVILQWGAVGDATYHNVRAINDMKPAQRDGVTIYPPVTVYDVDDNLEYTHPFNISFGTFGVRNIDGKLLSPGDDIWNKLHDGTLIPLWEDTKTGLGDGGVFDIERNRYTVNSTHKIAKASHGVTVPTPALASYFKNVIGCEQVYVFPNTVVESDYQWPNLAPRTDGSIRILWQGGDSHMGDWYYLKDALKELCAKYPQIKFVMWGSKYDWVYEAIPASQIEYHEWVPYEAYRYKRVLMDIDINLCPLVDTIFNKCKSAIKWYEGSIGPHPAATLASAFGPYLEIEDGKTGLLYKTPAEFVQKLSTLIEHADLRKKLAANAQQWVRQNRTPEATIPGLAEFYLDLRQRRAREAALVV
jgi:hypothetical protein